MTLNILWVVQRLWWLSSICPYGTKRFNPPRLLLLTVPWSSNGTQSSVSALMFLKKHPLPGLVLKAKSGNRSSIWPRRYEREPALPYRSRAARNLLEGQQDIGSNFQSDGVELERARIFNLISKPKTSRLYYVGRLGIYQESKTKLLGSIIFLILMLILASPTK